MKQQQEQDARKDGIRIPIEILVDYKSQGSYLFDFCRDLSSGGIFIETQQPKKVGESFELTFTLPDSKETIIALGRVIWTQEHVADMQQPAGMGVQFLNMEKENRELLEKFVKRYSTISSSRQ